MGGRGSREERKVRVGRGGGKKGERNDERKR